VDPLRVDDETGHNVVQCHADGIGTQKHLGDIDSANSTEKTELAISFLRMFREQCLNK
jgi:hypothetical protein